MVPEAERESPLEGQEGTLLISDEEFSSVCERGRMSADELGLSFATRKNSENKEEMQKSQIGALL